MEMHSTLQYVNYYGDNDKTFTLKVDLKFCHVRGSVFRVQYLGKTETQLRNYRDRDTSPRTIDSNGLNTHTHSFEFDEI